MTASDSKEKKILVVLYMNFNTFKKVDEELEI